MNDQELLDEIQREFGSQAPSQSDDPDDLDAFLSDLKKTISQTTPTPVQSEPGRKATASSRGGRQSGQPAKKDPSPRQKKPVRKPSPPAKIQEENDLPRTPPRGFTGFLLRHRKPINIFLLCLCLVLAGAIAAVIFYDGGNSSMGTTIMENVVVAGVDVGGMTREEALEAVNKAIGTNYTQKAMTVHLGSAELILSPSQSRPVLQLAGAIDEAYAYGRTGSTSQRQRDFRDAMYAPKVISLEPYLSLNTDYIRNTVSGFVSGFSGDYSPSGYTLEGTMPALNADEFDKSAPCQTLVLQTGTPGSHFDLEGICNAILDGYYTNQFEVEIPASCLPEFPEPLDIDAIYAELHVDAKEAQQDSAAGKEIPGSCGYTFPLEDTRRKLETAGFGATISVPLEYIVPQRLEFNGSYVETLSSFSTPIDGDEAYLSNLKLLCKQLDGMVLKSGERFSFNTDLPRTESGGFVKAFRHGSKCGDEDIGGGADQMATTLYVASKTAGLNVAEKYVADHVCGYTTLGTEISVSASWQDLKLTNSLDFPVKIRAKVTSQKVTIQILSEKPLNYYIGLVTQATYPTAHGTVFVSKRAADGYTNDQVLTEGVDGGQVTLQWVKYDKATDKELSRTTEYVSVPPLHTTIVKVSG